MQDGGEPGLDHLCLFMDVDGTLLDLAPAPGQATVPQALVADLARLRPRLGGALALVSGRTIAQLDELFAPLCLPASGVHGLERRAADGRVVPGRWDAAALAAITAAVEARVAGRARLEVERKPGALALHYRQQPQDEDALRTFMLELAGRYQPQFQLIDGNRVLELVPAGCSKSAAVEQFMAEPPFRGRRPIYLGDDTTDFGAFETVRRHDGVDVAVGGRVAARWHLPGPADVRDWIARLAQAGASPA